MAAAEWHYAPMTGAFMKKLDGQVVPVTDWSHRHELLNEFLELRSQGRLSLIDDQTYGHELFHGHSGQVLVYRQIENDVNKSVGVITQGNETGIV
jgi:hypothetical protein